MKPKTHFSGIYKNKLHHTIGAETFRKKEQIQIGAMKILFISSFNVFNKVLQQYQLNVIELDSTSQ